MKTSLREAFRKCSAPHAWREAADRAAEAAEIRAESERRLAADREQFAASQTKFITDAVALAFQIGRLQGRAEVMCEQLAGMAARAERDD